MGPGSDTRIWAGVGRLGAGQAGKPEEGEGELVKAPCLPLRPNAIAPLTFLQPSEQGSVSVSWSTICNREAPFLPQDACKGV